MKVLAVHQIKGGVGKTAAAVNLASLAAAGGKRTLLWDLDPQGAASFYFRIAPGGGRDAHRLVSGERELGESIKGTDQEGLDLIPSDLSYRDLDLILEEAGKPRKRILRLLAGLEEEYDLVFLDCPPGISLAAEAVFRASDALLVPVIPTTLSVRTLDQLLGFLAEREADWLAVMAFFSMVDRRKSLHHQIMEELPRARPELLSASIPSSSEVERMGLLRRPLVASAPSSPAAEAYRELWREILGRLGGG